jgi:hypothetical protein
MPAEECWGDMIHGSSRQDLPAKGLAASFCVPAVARKCSSVAIAIAAKSIAARVVPAMLGAKISARLASATKWGVAAAQPMPRGPAAIALDRRA